MGRPHLTLGKDRSDLLQPTGGGFLQTSGLCGRPLPSACMTHGGSYLQTQLALLEALLFSPGSQKKGPSEERNPPCLECKIEIMADVMAQGWGGCSHYCSAALGFPDKERCPASHWGSSKADAAIVKAGQGTGSSTGVTTGLEDTQKGTHDGNT